MLHARSDRWLEGAASNNAGRNRRHYSDLAIETALTLRTVFRLALRQSEGLIESIMNMVLTDGRNGHAE